MDGVLIKGSKAIESAHPALQLLQERQVPWILMTNGGGVSEQSRAERLSKTVNIPVEVEQIIQSHTPLRLLPDIGNKTALVVGGEKDACRAVARDYGFGKVLLPCDFIKTYPAIWPFHSKETYEIGIETPGIDEIPVDNIVIFNDPRDLGTDIQVIMDVLRRNPDCHVIFSNNDWVWANNYKDPRFGQGLVRLLLEKLYLEIYGKDLNRTIIGKPTKFSYDYAHHILIQRSNHLHRLGLAPSEFKFGNVIDSSHMKQVFMVGDNPASDIIGGFNYGWDTGLVRTGVYKDGDKLPCTPTVIADNVYEVVKFGLQRAGLF